MTWTYNDSNLTTTLNQVRRLINDVNSTNPLFSDEEINFYIDESSNIYNSASLACSALMAKYAEQVTKSVGDMSAQFAQKYEHYKGLYETYAKLSKSRGTPQVYAGGISISDKNTNEADTDWPKPDFYHDMHDGINTISNST